MAAILFVIGFLFLQHNPLDLEDVGKSVLDTNKQLFALTGFAAKDISKESAPKPIEVASDIKLLKDEFEIQTGQPFYLKVTSELGEVKFSDGTKLFDISPDGIVSFTPKEDDIGEYITTIFADTPKGKYEYKIVRFKIIE